MGEHMSAREALEIVKGGHPGAASVAFGKPEGIRYARACAIVEALVDFHEARCAEWDSARAVPASELAINKWYHVRALERGEESK